MIHLFPLTTVSAKARNRRFMCGAHHNAPVVLLHSLDSWIQHKTWQRDNRPRNQQRVDRWLGRPLRFKGRRLRLSISQCFLLKSFEWAASLWSGEVVFSRWLLLFITTGEESGENKSCCCYAAPVMHPHGKKEKHVYMTLWYNITHRPNTSVTHLHSSVIASYTLHSIWDFCVVLSSNTAFMN